MGASSVTTSSEPPAALVPTLVPVQLAERKTSMSRSVSAPPWVSALKVWKRATSVPAGQRYMGLVKFSDGTATLLGSSKVLVDNR